MANVALVQTVKGAKQEVLTREIPTAKANELIVKNHAVATNPVDYLMRDFGYLARSLPIVYGSDIAGVVEAVGPDVTKFKKGDRVAGFACVLGTGDADHGAFQQYSKLWEHAIVKLPDSWSFEEGATLPMSFVTPGMALISRQGISKTSSPKKEIYLVWGASSSIGTAAVQFARLLGFTVFATASPKNFDYIKSLGASQVFDYNDAEAKNKIIAAAEALGEPVTYGFAAASANGASSLAANVLAASAAAIKKTTKLAISLDWPAEEKQPEGVEISMTIAAEAFYGEEKHGAWLFNEFLQQKLESGEYKASPPVEVVGHRVEDIDHAIDLHKAGISGKKLVVTLV